MMTALKNADPVRDHVVPYDEALLLSIVAQPRPVPAMYRRRKVVIAAWLSAILVPIAGVSAAGAAGIMPNGARAALGDLVGDRDPDHAIDLSTARLVFTQPAPGGRRWEVWTAYGPQGWQCLSVNETPELSVLEAVSAHSTRGVAGGVCDDRDQFRAFGLGMLTENSFAFAAGSATRAELRLKDGTVTNIAAQNGWLAWFGVTPPADNTGAIHVNLLSGAVLTGYASDGSVVAPVGRIDLTVP
jgi:hypothetical protein